MKYTLLMAVACAIFGACHASIDQTSQKVGPKYFFGADAPMMNLESESPSTEKPGSNEVEPEVDAPMTVRRVILMPAFTRTLISSGESGAEESSHDDFPRFFRPPSLMPLLFPQHFMRRPLASSSGSEEPLVAATSSLNNREREDTNREAQPTNPVDLLLDMMTKALRSHGMVPTSGQQDETTDSSADKALEKSAPRTTNETHEEIVTINGRKYLKKSVVYRNFGDNIMFLTRRLIFTPLDEVEASTNATTIEATPSTDSKSSPATDAPVPKDSTTEQASTKFTEETSPTSVPVIKVEPSLKPEKVVEVELTRPLVSTEPAAIAAPEKPIVETISSKPADKPADKPIPSSEPDFVRV